jgi:hypothetical protein
MLAVALVTGAGRVVPETEGKSLEQIQQAWAEHDQGRQASKKPAYTTD